MAARAIRGWLAGGADLELVVVSDSMVPLLRTGDRVVVRPASSEDVHTGDLVLVQTPERYVLHRLISRRLWRTAGDALVWADPPLHPSSIAGRAVRIMRNGESFELPAFPLNRLAVLRWLGRALVVRVRIASARVARPRPRRPA